MQTTITPHARKWLAIAALHQIQETSTAEAHLGTEALAELLAGTPAETEAVKLRKLTEEQAAAAKEIRRALDGEFELPA